MFSVRGSEQLIFSQPLIRLLIFYIDTQNTCIHEHCIFCATRSQTGNVKRSLGSYAHYPDLLANIPNVYYQASIIR
jgi:hypothetical protein